MTTWQGWTATLEKATADGGDKYWNRRVIVIGHQKDYFYRHDHIFKLFHDGQSFEPNESRRMDRLLARVREALRDGTFNPESGHWKRCKNNLGYDSNPD